MTAKEQAQKEAQELFVQWKKRTWLLRRQNEMQLLIDEILIDKIAAALEHHIEDARKAEILTLERIRASLLNYPNEGGDKVIMEYIDFLLDAARKEKP